MTTHHLLMIVISQWRHGHYRHGAHWQHWHQAFRYIRRLTGPKASAGYIRDFLRFLVRHHHAPRTWARWNQA